MAKDEKEVAKVQSNPKVKTVHMAIGVDFIGSKTSLDHQKYDMEATTIGIKATSRASGRVIVLPYSNVKGFELLPENGVGTGRSHAAARTEQALKEARALSAKNQQVANQPQAPAAPVLSDEEQAEAAKEARKAAREKARLVAEQSLVSNK